MEKYYKSETWALVEAGKLHRLPANHNRLVNSVSGINALVIIYACHTGDATTPQESKKRGKKTFVHVSFLPDKEKYQLCRIFNDYSGQAPNCWGVPAEDNLMTLVEIREYMHLLISTTPFQEKYFSNDRKPNTKTLANAA